MCERDGEVQRGRGDPSARAPVPTRAPASLGGACGWRRREGADLNQLGVLAAADPLEFVGTRRLEEEAAAGAYTWRSILSGWFRSPLPSCTWRSIL